MEWLVVYQDVPYNHTDPRTLIIEAETEADARATAADILTRRGYTVYEVISSGKTHIREVIPYKPSTGGTLNHG